jgi:hypothetical protein
MQAGSCRNGSRLVLSYSSWQLQSAAGSDIADRDYYYYYSNISPVGKLLWTQLLLE